MKNKLLPLCLAIFTVLAMSSCSKKITQTDNKFKKIDQPFSAQKYFSDKKHYRSTGQGKSLDLTVAKRIAAALRTSDHVYRIGGDEFTAILTHLNSQEDIAGLEKKFSLFFSSLTCDVFALFILSFIFHFADRD